MKINDPKVDNNNKYISSFRNYAAAPYIYYGDKKGKV
jgi:hypothetical protein